MAGGENSDKKPSPEHTTVNWTVTEEATLVQVVIAGKWYILPPLKKSRSIAQVVGHTPESRSPIPILLPDKP
ncbi:hypothetical protein M422DRAFT_260351 [Sphaerobolus stellatus SS14]|uniref:Uncharacterized protein n=1 Tax=Sphaerobolus stellatus (strain SS14) TaxID=990650 RepID=A0A0C9V6G5_SPHS4|nr:hypothetical protein M422DRAFT_260351 [Sphaerobolus stellatus SS14]